MAVMVTSHSVIVMHRSVLVCRVGGMAAAVHCDLLRCRLLCVTTLYS
jgi:hypothetical protein